jgi:peroxiredoxin
MRLLLPALLVLAITARAAEPPAGHSMHGEAFNEGPRQAAVLMPGTGAVDFKVTTKNDLAQKFFNQGVGQLHGFWYFEAERSFRQVAALDADCAMAYWGMAMANINNPERAAKLIKDATARKASASRREQMWIDSLAAYYADTKADERKRREALITAMEDLSAEFPDDIEVKAMLVFQLWDNKAHGVPLGSRRAVDAIAREVLAVNPMHPGVHHYRIHLWNGANGDKRAVDSAARCGQSAPAIAHMWHMSGHTFSNLKRYADAAWQQEASARVDHAHTIAARILPDQIHNFAHNNDWLAYDLAYIGRVHDSVDLAKNMMELPRPSPTNSKSYNMGRTRLLETLLRYDLWDDIAALDGTMYFADDDAANPSAPRIAAVGAAAFRKGDKAKGEAKIAELEALLKRKRAERLAAADAAEEKAKGENKTDDQIEKAMTEALRRGSFPVKAATEALAEVRIYQALAEGRREDAKKALAKADRIPAERRARLTMEAGDAKEAEKLARDAAKGAEKQVPALATLAGVLWQAGKKDDAKKTFNELRELSAQCDLDVALFANLAPIAAELNLPSDWRVALKWDADSGTRPDLAALGPFRWSPSAAPAWSLPEISGRTISLADYRGKPVLVVFYLGSGCSHCIEQLNVFGPMAKEYRDAGISIVAVSADSADGLFRTFVQAKDSEGFPFPILADPELTAFKAYRAYDDFERSPLHGTFLIDGAGRVRWQDISYQPFRDAKWLLGESKRLLSVPATPPAVTAR